MKIGIHTFERQEGKAKDSAGSSRIRARWLIKYWPEAEEFIQGADYDFIIYQKSYWCEHAKAFKGFKIFDLCDPDWMHFGYRTKEMIEEVDVITTSTEPLAETIRKFTDKPVVCVPDRLDLEKHKEKKVHSGDAKSVVWFGYSTGFTLLNSAVTAIDNLGLELIVISNAGFVLPSHYQNRIELTNYPWTLETVNKDIIKGDILLNPKSDKTKWKYKSNNKTLTAWALGVPVAKNVSELKKFIKEEARIEESKKRLIEIKEKYDVKLSVKQYKEIISKYEKN